MKNKREGSRNLGSMVSVALLVLTALLSINISLSNAASDSGSDTLYVGDVVDNSVQSYDAVTGDFQGTTVKKSLAGLKGPRGIVLPQEGYLLVSDQNFGSMGAPGDIILYNIGAVKFDFVVQCTRKDAPFAPRGIISASGDYFYVADQTAGPKPKKNESISPGRVRVYTKEGVFVRDLTPPHTLTPDGYLDEIFHPQGLVIGPDRLLYVSSRLFPSGAGGQVLRFDLTDWSFKGVFISDVPGGAGQHLNRPEGLVFGPDDGNLYVTSLRADAEDYDKIEIYQGPSGASPGTFVDEIKIDITPPGTRAFAGACVFGPGEKLFVPIAGTPPDSGSVRRYDVTTKNYDVFVKPGGPLVAGGYLTFGKTNPATLDYNP